jgi:hypothetical protein
MNNLSHNLFTSSIVDLIIFNESYIAKIYIQYITKYKRIIKNFILCINTELYIP